MSIEHLEMIHQIGEAQLEALRRRDFHALGLLQHSRHELMLQMEKRDSRPSPPVECIQELLDRIFETERALRREFPSASLSCPEAAWL